MQNQKAAFVTRETSVELPEGASLQQIQSDPSALTMDGAFYVSGAPPGYEMPEVPTISRLPLYNGEVLPWEPDADEAPSCFRSLRPSHRTCWILVGTTIVLLLIVLVFCLLRSEVANPAAFMKVFKLAFMLKWTAKHKAIFGIIIAELVPIVLGSLIGIYALYCNAVGRFADELIAYTVAQKVWRFADEKQLADYREMGTVIAAHLTEVNELLGVNHRVPLVVIAQRMYEQKVLQSRRADATSHPQYGRKINLRTTTSSAAAPYSSVPNPNDVELETLSRDHTDSTLSHHTENEEVPDCGTCDEFDCLRCGRQQQELVMEPYGNWDKPVAMRILMTMEWAKAEEKRLLHIECKKKAKHLYGKLWLFKIMNHLDWGILCVILVILIAAIAVVLKAYHMKG